MPARRQGQPLTTRERAFVTALLGPARGNATQAAILAGYSSKTAGVQGSQLLNRLNIQNAVDKGLERVARSSIADKVERDELATGIMRNPFLSPKERLRAMDTLNKVDGRYVKRHEHDHKGRVEHWLGMLADER